MSFSLVTLEQKIRILNSAKAEFQGEIYKCIAKLGHNPETYNISTWNFDAASVAPEDDAEYNIKSSITNALARITHIDARIAELS